MKWICAALVLAVASFDAGSCSAWGSVATASQPSPDVQDVIQRITSEKPEARTQAVSELQTLQAAGIDPSVARALLEAAGKLRGPLDSDAAVALVRAAFSTKAKDLVESSAQEFPSLLPPAKQEVLSQLSFIPDPKATESFMKLFAAHARDDSMTSLPPLGFARAGQLANVVFPAILAWADDPRFSAGVYQLALEYCAMGKMDAPLLNSIEPVAVRTYERWNQAESRGDGAPHWWWREEFAPRRHTLSIVLSLLGYTKSQQSIATLKNALTLEDPRLRMFAATSLVRRRQTVESATLSALAAELETRNTLYELLRGVGWLGQFPREYASQERLAEGDLARWLCQPGELGSPPGEVQLAKSVHVPARDEDWYIFRYRVPDPHWASSEGWLIGVAGPYPRAEQPKARGAGTFSPLAPWSQDAEAQLEVALSE